MLRYVIGRIVLAIAEHTGMSPKLAFVLIVAAVPLLAWAARALYYAAEGRPEPTREFDIADLFAQPQAQTAPRQEVAPGPVGAPQTVVIRHYYPEDDDPILYGQTHLSYPIRGKAKGDA